MYITNNDGDEWWPFSDGLTNMNVTALAIDQNGLVLAGTSGGGVFRASLPVSVPELATSTFTLEQNVPNPCDGTTTIAYSLRTAAHVQLALLDAHGRTVAELVDATQPPGRNTVAVATARLAPGLYAYTLTVEGQRMTKRMMVVH
ncbi:MAG: T9SS type A sorting domain-containing protein [Flavobacteriales bacterium]|nr:MAG: T9SS type A sorting domain-containing protein [Flavobacteriales bacterium]